MEFTEIARVFGVLLLVIAVMVGALHLIKRLGMPGVGQSNGNIRIFGQRTLGGRERLLVVEVDSRRFLIGVTAQSINRLSELDASSEQGNESEPEVPPMLSKWFGKAAAGSTASGSPGQ